jgi:hypothetical protein
MINQSVKNLQFCIINRTFDENLGYRENVTFMAIGKLGHNCDIYCIIGNKISPILNDDSYNLFICSPKISFNDISLAFNLNVFLRRYDIAFIHEVRQLFTFIYYLVLKIKGVIIIYEHEQRSDGLSFFSRMYSKLFVRPMLYVVCKSADFIRSPNKISSDYLVSINQKFRSKIVEIPLAVNTNIFYPSEQYYDGNRQFKLCWTGKNPSAKNISIIIDALSKIDPTIAKKIEFTIVTNEALNISVNGVLVREINGLLTATQLGEFYRSCSASIWTTPTQSYFESAACGNFVLCPLNGLPQSIAEYSDAFISIDCETNMQGLATRIECNVDKYAEAILHAYELWLSKTKTTGYSYSGEKYLSTFFDAL